jgi:hypothetical protein
MPGDCSTVLRSGWGEGRGHASQVQGAECREGEDSGNEGVARCDEVGAGCNVVVRVCNEGDVGGKSEDRG